MSEKARFVGINHVALDADDQFLALAAYPVSTRSARPRNAEAEMREKGLL
jgi:hypothetical protein